MREPGDRRSRTAHAMLLARRRGDRAPTRRRGRQHPPGAFNPLPEDWGLDAWYVETGSCHTQFFAHEDPALQASTASRNRPSPRSPRRRSPTREHPNAWRRGRCRGRVLASRWSTTPDAVNVLARRGRGRSRSCWRGRAGRRPIARTPVYLARSRLKTRRFGSFGVHPVYPDRGGAVADDRGRGRAFEQAGIGPEDVDVAQLQDPTESRGGLHLADRPVRARRAGALIQSGATNRDGRLRSNRPTAADSPRRADRRPPACDRSTSSCCSCAATRVSARSAGPARVGFTKVSARRGSARARFSSAEPRGGVRPFAGGGRPRGQLSVSQGEPRQSDFPRRRGAVREPARRVLVLNTWTSVDPGCGCG